MAARPWVTPDEVRAYTNKDEVKSRTDEQLEVDIARAESYVMAYTHNNFLDVEEIPEPVRIAVLILAESYSWNAYIATSLLKSETFDDYSYTSGAGSIDIADLGLDALLDPFIRVKPSGNVFLRMRKL